MAVAPYPTLESILNISRMRINDMIVSAGGQTLQDTAPFTLPMCNVAYQKFQQLLVSLS